MGDLVLPAHESKYLPNHPRERYEFAARYLPLPAAFREAAKGLLAIVRERLRDVQPLEEPLRKLYRLASVKNLVIGDSTRWVSVRSFHAQEAPWEPLRLKPAGIRETRGGSESCASVE